MLLGPDVSSYQAQPDWSTVAAAGRAFAWTKATEGTDYVNPFLEHNWLGIRAAGMIRGAYHYGRPDQNPDPEAEADHFLSTLEGIDQLAPSDLLALDLEAGGGNLLDWALGWLDYVSKQFRWTSRRVLLLGDLNALRSLGMSPETPLRQPTWSPQPARS